MTLNALPNKGYRFVNWSGDVENQTNETTTVTMNDDKIVIANFEEIQQDQYTLTISVNPSDGGITIPPVGHYSYNEGATITLAAIPFHGYRFLDWSGDIAYTTDDTTTVIMTVNRSIIAHFEKQANPNLTFVSIPGGTFQMEDEVGDLWSGCRPVHTVTVASFEMSVYEVTNAQYVAYLTEALKSGDITASSSTVNGASGEYGGQVYLNIGDSDCQIIYSGGTFTIYSGLENRPVIEVTWFGAKAFVLYYGLDLPTEAEWENSCRGGRQLQYGTDNGILHSTKVNYDIYVGHTTDVGSYPANLYGLYDMSGNIWECCHDWYGDYSNESVNNPIGVQYDTYRILRGGSWNYEGNFCRSSCRRRSSPDYSDAYIGIRVVRRSSPKE